mmetsp:Transcript_5157/g.6668  ORF Transcript_5157/g.6668 Transcript_5157/m.6668 type:complete len:395 (+) Transcript_5157:198-1382(+)
MTQNEKEQGLKNIIFEMLNFIVELYLAHVIKPFLTLHEKIYSWLNATIRSVLDDNSEKIPKWFTANFITYVRTLFVVPCVILMVKGHVLLPSIIVLSVDFGDFLDGVVARYWVDIHSNEDLETLVTEPDESSKDKPVITESWVTKHRNKTYGGFIDAVCDKAFVVPCWLSLLSTVPACEYLRTVQFITLWSLILTETASGCVRFKAYYTSNGVPAPVVKGYDFSTSAVKADHIGKAKQTFEMVGTAFLILPFSRYFGLIFLVAAVPLAYESVRRKINKRVMYVNGTGSGINHKTLKFWKQAKNMGSKLVVGITSKDKEMIENACSSESVDTVISNVPAKLSLNYLNEQGIDFVVVEAGQSLDCITSEVASSKRCLVIGNDGVASILEAKEVKLE